MKNIANLQKMLKQAKEMQEKLQEELAQMRVEGTSGGGMVIITLDGQKNIVSLRIDPEVVNREEVEMLQDLIVAAFADASRKVDESMAEKFGQLGSSFKIPGLF